MHTYKAYRMDKKRRFRTGCWIDASTDKEARRKAADLCEEGAATIEVWRDSQRIDEIDCGDGD